MTKKTWHLIALQGAVMIYSINTIVAKFVSQESFLSPRWILLYMLEFAVLGVYAILWQQIIKHFDISVAYANKATSLVWSLLWSVLLFHEGVSLLKIAGIAVTILGIILINTDSQEEA